MAPMTKNAIDTFINIENAAHAGAFGNNPRATPTDAQAKAGNYKVGRATIYGLPVAIEQPRHSYRTGQDPNGKRWENKMAAHYGYFSGTKGADGDGVDCFIGFFPQSEQVYIINQYVNGKFDEHKVCLCFPDDETAKRAYLDSYDKGWNGLHSIITASITQFKWWLKNGNMNNQIALNHLPFEGLETMKQRVAWDSAANPIGTALHKVLYEIQRADGSEALIFDSVCMADIMDAADEVMALDAMVTPYAKLERKMQVLKSVMDRHSDTIKVEAVQVSDPFKQSGVAQVAVIFELSDGQTISIFFHNPDVDPKKIQQSDQLVSWKWLLNRKDITVVVAPERGLDLNIKEVSARIMRLADKNSAAFKRANVNRAEKMQAIEAIKTEIVTLEQELKDVQHELEVAKVDAEDRAAKGGDSIEPENKDGIELMRQDVLALFPELEGPNGKPNGFGISKITLMPGNKIVIESNTKKVLVAETVAKSTETGITYMDIIDQFNKGNIKSVPTEVTADPIAKKEAFIQATLQALIDKFGWTNRSKTNLPLFYVTKRIGGGHTGGMINPEGIREVIAKIEGSVIMATHGDSPLVTAAFSESATPEQNAKALDDAVNAIDPNYVAPVSGADNNFEIYRDGNGASGKVDSAYEELFQMKNALDELDNPAGTYYGVDKSTPYGDVIYSFQAETAIMKASSTIQSIDEFKPIIEDAIRWGNTELGQYGTDWMLRNLPAHLALTRGISVEWAKKAIAFWFEGDAGQEKLKGITGGVEIDWTKATGLNTDAEVQALGIARIDEIGSENVYIEKDGKPYYMKPASTNGYQVGEYDFSNDRPWDDRTGKSDGANGKLVEQGIDENKAIAAFAKYEEALSKVQKGSSTKAKGAELTKAKKDFEAAKAELQPYGQWMLDKANGALNDILASITLPEGYSTRMPESGKPFIAGSIATPSQVSLYIRKTGAETGDEDQFAVEVRVNADSPKVYVFFKVGSQFAFKGRDINIFGATGSFKAQTYDELATAVIRELSAEINKLTATSNEPSVPTKNIDTEITDLENLVGSGDAFDEKMDALIEKIDAAGLMPQYEPKLLQLDRDNSNANVKSAGI
jgi:hypothetical protein